MENKTARAVLPALLIHLSVGTVYCWSTIKDAIAERIGMSPFAVGWAFSLAIFFLGMSAAFAGPFVERDIRLASLVSCICFSAGMAGTGLCIHLFTGPAALAGICLCYGALMGVGLGLGYLVPVKTLMLWFSESKGMAAGISVMGFGLAKVIATPIMISLMDSRGIVGMFWVLSGVYFVLLYVGHLLLKKPEGWQESERHRTGNRRQLLRQREFLGIWLMFFLNTHCGLMIISCEQQLLTTAFALSANLSILVSVVPSLSAVCNGLGRIGLSSLSDHLNQRNTVYKLIFVSCFLITMVTYLTHALSGATTAPLGAVVLLFLFLINTGYGGGFSTLPALLSERFGMQYLSEIHGLALSAWAVAGLTGNNCSELIFLRTGMYENLLLVCAGLYALALLSCAVVVGSRQRCEGQLISLSQPGSFSAPGTTRPGERSTGT